MSRRATIGRHRMVHNGSVKQVHRFSKAGASSAAEFDLDISVLFPNRYGYMSIVALRRRKTLRVAIPLRSALLRLLVVALTFSAFAVMSPSAPTAAVSVEDVIEEQLLSQLNDERAARGLPALATNSSLENASRGWSDTMASSSSLHHSSDGRAEIIARGWWSGQITDAWMRSDGHRNLVVDPNLGWAGVGVTCDSSGQVWATVQFLRIDRSLGTLDSSARDPQVTASSTGSDCGEQSSIDQVRRVYVAYFRRESDNAGLAFWASKISDGAPLGEVSHAFASSQEFVSRYGNLSDRKFVGLVYVNVLDREPDEAGYKYWTDQLDAGMSRGELMIGFSESGEFRYTTGID